VTQQLIEWLIDGVPGAKHPVDVAERIGVELTAAGVPIDRLTVLVMTLHPTIAGRQFRWRPDAGASVGELSFAVQSSAAFRSSPLAVVAREKTEFRRRLDDSLQPGAFGILDDLRKEGFTDYFCAPLVFTTGEMHGVTFATRAPVGFTDAHLHAMRSISKPLARIAEIFALRRVATTLLNTYVGHDSGARILQGRITRGDVELLPAVIWFSDLRGFTEMSSRCAPGAILDVLNELFDCQVPAIEEHGGEVLKFIGDGLLAIFALDKQGDVRKRCSDALLAARDSFAALDLRNERSGQPIRFGLALHVGEVAYGNIGSASRLDFTVIGSAINLAARLEGLTGKLDRRIVLSSDLATYAAVPLTDLGEFDLKGVPGRQRVFGLVSP
jgi:adenylate cyclase